MASKVLKFLAVFALAVSALANNNLVIRTYEDIPLSTVAQADQNPFGNDYIVGHGRNLSLLAIVDTEKAEIIKATKVGEGTLTPSPSLAFDNRGNIFSIMAGLSQGTLTKFTTDLTLEENFTLEMNDATPPITCDSLFVNEGVFWCMVGPTVYSIWLGQNYKTPQWSMTLKFQAPSKLNISKWCPTTSGGIAAVGTIGTSLLVMNLTQDLVITSAWRIVVISPLSTADIVAIPGNFNVFAMTGATSDSEGFVGLIDFNNEDPVQKSQFRTFPINSSQSLSLAQGGQNEFIMYNSDTMTKFSVGDNAFINEWSIKFSSSVGAYTVLPQGNQLLGNHDGFLQLVEVDQGGNIGTSSVVQASIESIPFSLLTFGGDAQNVQKIITQDFAGPNPWKSMKESPLSSSDINVTAYEDCESNGNVDMGNVA
eukprot:CAMPEP_0115038564 /NCGR_PEP_ID=MMETSP0216-20121206/43485_1 /TAXON_ID=223996 /ORGANISM="Protocruzia adherens, Strain Boccale" /LENGTH=423 /DNA_ID=CAMNT_0002418991 /DNA_START=30 /DNA_END=1301 /DNA_ORIENTATION=+